MKKVVVSSIQLFFLFLRYRDESFWRHNRTLPFPILSRPVPIVVRSGSKNLEPARISAGIGKKNKGYHVTEMQCDGSYGDVLIRTKDCSTRKKERSYDVSCSERMTCILDDDEVDIEAEIQRELDALEDDSLHIEDVEDETSTLETDEVIYSFNLCQN